MGVVKGHSFQRYGFFEGIYWSNFRSRLHNQRMLGLPLQTHKLTSPKQKRLREFPGWWFQFFFTLTWGYKWSNLRNIFFQMGWFNQHRWRDGHPQRWCPKSEYGALNALGPHVTGAVCLVFFFVFFGWKNVATTTKNKGFFCQRCFFFGGQVLHRFLLVGKVFVLGFLPLFFQDQKGWEPHGEAFSWRFL